MSKHSEKDFIIPAIRVIYDNNCDCPTAIVKEQISNYIVLSPEDLEPSVTRNEPKYKQVIGNLISHRTPEFFKYLVTNNEQKGVKQNLVLNEEGIKLAESYISKSYSMVIPDSFVSEPTFVYEASFEPTPSIDEINQTVVDAISTNGVTKRMPTSSKVVQTVNKLNNYKCQYAILTGKKHNTIKNKDNVPIVNGHHLVPMKAAIDFAPINLDRPANIVTLCPNCHEAIHHANYKEREEMLKVLYDNYIDGLNDNDIYISFNDLFNKYYK